MIVITCYRPGVSEVIHRFPETNLGEIEAEQMFEGLCSGEIRWVKPYVPNDDNCAFVKSHLPCIRGHCTTTPEWMQQYMPYLNATAPVKVKRRKRLQKRRPIRTVRRKRR